ncbi:h domain protein [Nocardia sp. NPDC055321]
MRLDRIRNAAAVLTLVAVAAVIVLGINAFRYVDQRDDDQRRQDAVDAASRTVTAMFSYDHATVDTELPKAADGLSGDFRSDYLRLVHDAIAPGAKEKKLTVKATVVASGIISDDSTHAVVLLFLNQLTTGADTPQGTSTGSRARVSLVEEDGRWLISQVTPI